MYVPPVLHMTTGIVPVEQGPPRPRHASSQSRLKGSKKPTVIVELDLWPSFATVWVIILICHGLCAAYAWGATQALLLAANPDMDYFADLLRLDIQPVLRFATTLYKTVMVVHLIRIALILWGSLRSRSLRFGSLVSDVFCFCIRPEGASPPRIPIAACFRRAWRSIFGRHGLFGVEFRYYEYRYAVSESVEVISQTLQAYSSSALLDPTRWLIDLYVAFVVLNCWSTPIVQRVLHSSTASTKRLVCTAVDAMLDAGTAMMLPQLLILPYIQAFDFTLFTFETRLLYDDVWFIVMINENRQIFPLSYTDLFIKFIPHVSIYLSLKTIESIVTLKSNKKKHTDSASSRQSQQSHHSRRATRVLSAIVHSRLPTTSDLKREVQRARIIDRCFMLWGLAVASCHVVSSMTHPPLHEGCRQPLRPWFVREAACAVFEYNCYRQHTLTVDPDVLESLHAPSMSILLLTHCPALHVPPAIHQFRNLVGIDIFNSTISHWGADAAISALTTPFLTYVFFVRTNLSVIPPGILGPDLPTPLADIEFVVTNLTSVPDNLDSVWSHVGSLYIEHSQLTVVPETLLRMSLIDFSLVNNGISSLPDAFALGRGAYQKLSLALNPIATLPRSLAEARGAASLNLIATQISDVPAWLVAATSRIFIKETPFCAAHGTEPDYMPTDARVSCSYWSERVRGRYPLAVTAPLRVP